MSQAPGCDLCGHYGLDVALSHDGRTELRTDDGKPFQEPCEGCGPPLRLVVAGSRSISLRTAKRALHVALEGLCWFDAATSVLHGDSRGPDKAGAAWGHWKGLPVVPYPAKWDDIDVEGAVVRTREDGTKYNPRAGPMRNEELSKDGHALLALWDGKSSGTKDIIGRFRKKDKPVEIIEVEE